MSLVRPAPSADRTAISEARAVERASSMLATLAQARRMTMPTVNCSSSMIVMPSSSIRDSMTGADAKPQPRF